MKSPEPQIDKDSLILKLSEENSRLSARLKEASEGSSNYYARYERERTERAIERLEETLIELTETVCLVSNKKVKSFLELNQRSLELTRSSNSKVNVMCDLVSIITDNYHSNLSFYKKLKWWRNKK